MSQGVRRFLKLASVRLFLQVRPLLLALLVTLTVCGNAAAQAEKDATPHFESEWPGCAQGGPVVAAPSPTVRRSYIEIVYDARVRELWWFDRKGIAHGGAGAVRIDQNSVFAPVTFAKDRIIVTICNAKFNTEPSISVATTVIPEGAPDIRGLTSQNTAAALPVPVVTPLADVKQAAAVTTPKTAEDYAQMAASYHKTFQRLTTELLLLRCSALPCALDTIQAIQTRAGHLLADLPNPPPYSDQAAFDSFSAQTRSLVDSINSLAVTLVAGDYLNRATSAAVQFAALRALPASSASPDVDATVNEALEAARTVTAATKRTDFPADAKGAAGAAVTALIKAAGDLQADPSAAEANITSARSAAQLAEAYLLKARQNGYTTDEPAARRLLETAKRLLKAVQAKPGPPSLDDIDRDLARYLGAGASFKNILTNDLPELLFRQTDALTQQVATLHGTASTIFERMNSWREASRVTLTGVVPPTGGNAVFTVHIILHEAYAPFAFGTPPKKDASSDGPKSTSGTITASSATGAAPEQHEVRRVLVEVHRRADVNLVGAIVGSTIPNRQYGLQPGTPMTTATGPVIPYYPYQNQDEHVQIQGVAGINWYPGGRDFYPGYLRGTRRLIPGILFGTTVTAAGNFVGGLDFEPVNGFDLVLGGEVGPVTSLAPGVTLGSNIGGPYFATGDTVPTRQRLAGGFVFGVGFDVGVFTAVFSGASAPSSSSPSSTPAQ